MAQWSSNHLLSDQTQRFQHSTQHLNFYMSETPYTLQSLIDAVVSYKGRHKILPLNSVTGTVFGYTTVDSEGPAEIWEMPLKQAKQEAACFEDSDHILELLSSYMGRKQLADDLRKGAMKLKPMVFETWIPTPVQHYIPSL